MPCRSCAALFTALMLAASFAQATETPVQIELASGRVLSGILDARTDARQLWLRWRVGEVELQRPIAWERIKAAELDHEPIGLDALQSRVSELATPDRTTPIRPAASAPIPPRPVRSPLVRSIRCDAWLANWDADAPLDGLVLEVIPLDEFGQTMAAQGTVEAELTTIDYQPGYLNSTSGGRVPTSLGHWSQGWSAGRFLQLELSGRDPQRDRRLDRYGLLNVRVSIPGSGVFEQQIDGLRMRPFTPVQNSLWR